LNCAGVWSGVYPLQATVVTDDNNQLEYNILCRSNNDDAFIIALAVYKCILIGVAAIMAFLGRNLPNVLNESYFTFLTVYNVAFFTAIILPVTAVLSDDPEGTSSNV